MQGEYAKSQFLRLWDVFWLAPFLIYTGQRKSTLPKSVKALLTISGTFIIIYNGRNFLMNEFLKREGKLELKPTGLFQSLIVRK